MIEQPTRVPAAVDALVTRLTAAFEGDPLTVIDGPPLDYGSLPSDDVLCVGIPGIDGVSVDNDLEVQNGLGHPRYVETFRVHCVFSTVSGEINVKARRDRCLAVLTLIEDALKEDRGLGGVVDKVTLGGSMTWGQVQDGNGATVDVGFDIVGRAVL